MEKTDKVVIKKGLRFESCNDLISFMSQFSKQEKHIYVKGKGAKKFKHVGEANDILEYIYLPFKCQFGEIRPCESKKKIRQTRLVKFLYFFPFCEWN